MQLTKQQKQQIEKIGKKYDLKLMLLYGSYATNRFHRGSDLDIALLGEKPIYFRDILKISSELEGIFGNIPDRELDIASLHGDDPLFRYEAVKLSVQLYGSVRDYSEFKSYAFQSYLDAKDIFRLQKAMVQKYQNYLQQKYD